MATGTKQNRRCNGIGRQRRLAVELFEPRFVLSGAPTAIDPTVTAQVEVADELAIPSSHPCHNPRDPSDVNGDGFVSPSDVLLELNYLQAASDDSIQSASGA